MVMGKGLLQKVLLPFLPVDPFPNHQLPLDTQFYFPWLGVAVGVITQPDIKLNQQNKLYLHNRSDALFA